MADAPRLPDQPLAALAAEHGLKLSGARPTLSKYLSMLWQRRHFIIGYATARNVSMYTDARLGQIWQVLTPLVNAGVYFLMFGVILNTKHGVHDFIGYLCIGIFIYTFTATVAQQSVKCINDNL